MTVLDLIRDTHEAEPVPGRPCGRLRVWTAARHDVTHGWLSRILGPDPTKPGGFAREFLDPDSEQPRGTGTAWHHYTVPVANHGVYHAESWDAKTDAVYRAVFVWETGAILGYRLFPAWATKEIGVATADLLGIARPPAPPAGASPAAWSHQEALTEWPLLGALAANDPRATFHLVQFSHQTAEGHLYQVHHDRPLAIGTVLPSDEGALDVISAWSTEKRRHVTSYVVHRRFPDGGTSEYQLGAARVLHRVDGPPVPLSHTELFWAIDLFNRFMILRVRPSQVLMPVDLVPREAGPEQRIPPSE